MADISVTWFNALAGGSLIGVAVLIMMLTIGRIVGISGVFSSLLKPATTMSWQVAFIAGLFVTGLLVHNFYQVITVEVDSRLPILIISGLLVGFGTRLGNGCTSGHGICGISRFSIRSMLATLVFIGAGMLTVYLLRLVLGA